MVRKTLGLLVWLLVFQLIAYFINEYFHFHFTAWYLSLDKSPLHPPEIVFPLVWSTLYVMITIAGWLLWQEHGKKDAKTALKYYAVMVLMIWAWPTIIFMLHWIGIGFVWTLATMVVTLLVIISAAEKFEFAATLLCPVFLWLLYVSYLMGYLWLQN